MPVKVTFGHRHVHIECPCVMIIVCEEKLPSQKSLKELCPDILSHFFAHLNYGKRWNGLLTMLIIASNGLLTKKNTKG